MKYCNKCKVNVAGSREKCPLCQNMLVGLDCNGKIEKFPKINKKRNRLDGIWRIFLMVSIFAIFVCFIVNYQFPQHGFWCRFVAGGVLTSWILLFIIIGCLKPFLNLSYLKRNL